MDCPRKVAEWIIRWCCFDAMNIPAIKNEVAMHLAKLHLVIHPGELYELSEGDWQRVDGLNDEDRNEIKRQLEDSKNASPSALLFGFRINGVNLLLSKRLVQRFKNHSRLRGANIEELTMIEGVDAGTAMAIRRWFCDSFNKKMLKILERNGLRFS